MCYTPIYDSPPPPIIVDATDVTVGTTVGRYLSVNVSGPHVTFFHCLDVYITFSSKVSIWYKHKHL